ncbi:SpoIIE family protein phosphatase [Maribellus sediminis]|uniref:SpoIIE family protein phosphatase n=1 Tax=Maribellus sediminis TaxID=2696285 RepID=UPI0014303C5D|nr:SpoIIE family protein phosphatase [Maribellus sediminis]
MLNKSIAYRLSIYISLAVISVFVAFIIINFLFNLKIIKENIQFKADNTSIEVNSVVKKYVVTTQEVAKNIADQIIFYEKEDAIGPFLDKVLEKYPFINSIHIRLDSTIEVSHHYLFTYREADSTYMYESNKPIVTCVDKNPNYIELVQDPDVIWSEPIVCERNKHIVASYYSPVTQSVPNNKNKVVGSVICELSLLHINDAVNEIKVGNSGYSVLLSRKGIYISHPRKDFILERNAYDLPKKVIDLDASEINAILSGNTGAGIIAYPEVLDYQKSWLSFSRIQETGWLIVMVIPYAELFEPLYLPILKMLFFSVLGILVVYILITYISNKQIQPLSSLTSQLKRFSDISGEAYAGDASLNEIQQVSDSLNLIKSWYEKNRLKVSQDAKLDKIRYDDILEAAEIQQSLIKTEYPACPNVKEIDLFALYKPARIVSGDLFDYFFRDEKQMVFTMGDVSGKGVPAAFFMSMSQTIIKSVGANPELKRSAGIVEEVNEQLYSNNIHQFFLTLFLGIINIETGKLTYCNAAHTTSYVLKTNGHLDELKEAHGLPLGLYRDRGYHESKYQLEKGDSIIVYTDGVTELHDENNLQYGDYRLQENLRSLVGLKPKEMVKRLEKSLKQFIGDTDQSDDISILVIKYEG